MLTLMGNEQKCGALLKSISIHYAIWTLMQHKCGFDASYLNLNKILHKDDIYFPVSFCVFMRERAIFNKHSLSLHHFKSYWWLNFSFKFSETEKPKWLHTMVLNRRDDSSVFSADRQYLPGWNRPTVWQQIHRFDIGLPSVPRNIINGILL